MASRSREGAAEVEVASAQELRDWLARHHERAEGLWLVSYRKADPRYLAYPDIVDELLAWGWIDSLPRARDALRTMLWIAPRKPRSGWSRINKEKVARLEAAGRMAAPGRAAVARAKQDGSWSALDAVEALEVPADLGAALGPGLRPVWDGWPPSLRKGVLELLGNARTDATRQKRIADIVAAARSGERPFQWRRR